MSRPSSHCVVEGCERPGVQRVKWAVPDVVEQVEGLLCEDHKIDTPGPYSLGYAERFEDEARAIHNEQMHLYASVGSRGDTTFFDNSTPIPYRPNRAARRAAARKKR